MSVAYSGNGQSIACGGMDGSIYVFDVATGKSTAKLDGMCRFRVRLVGARVCVWERCFR
jgi:WD40 repeat protein